MARKLVAAVAVAALGGMVLSACGGNNSTTTTTTGGNFNRVLFASKRTTPGNNGTDADIFSVLTNAPLTLANLTDSGSTSGDDTDLACAVDVSSGRSNLIFGSERATNGNTAGDVDIFHVGLSGGTITNLTTATSGATDQDDACLGIVASTGAVVFESSRTDGGNVNTDTDLFVATLTLGSNNLVTGATISNRTQEASGTSALDRLVFIGASKLYYMSSRTGNDNSTTPIANANADTHIFTTTSSGTVSIINITDDGDANDAGGAAASTDQFCGIDSGERFVLFQSTRNQGSNALQFGTTGSGATDRDVFVRDLNVTSSFANLVNPSIGNLTDGATGTNNHGGNATNNPEDDQDNCFFGAGYNAVQTVGSSPVGIFVSSRTATGTHRSTATTATTAGYTVFSTLANHPFQGDPLDIFSTTLNVTASSGVLNTVTNLTDQATSGLVVNTGDRADIPVGFCGGRLIFQSTRSDAQTNNTAFEEDIFSVDMATGSSSRVNHTDGANAAGDTNDVFLCCNSFANAGQANGRMVFVSRRTDVGNTAVADTDLFTTSVASTAGTITNMTDHASDGNEIATAIPTTLTANVLGAAGVINAVGGFANLTPNVTGINTVPATAYDIAHGINTFRSAFNFACNTATDSVFFTSNRTQPLNSSNSDLDIFLIPFLTTSGSAAGTANVVNLTDNSTPANDSNDAITSLDGFAGALF